MSARPSRRAPYKRTMTPQGFTHHAILSLDPASSGDAGLALRGTAAMVTPRRGKLQPPAWTYSGSVWNTAMHDELSLELLKCVPRGGRVCFVATSTAFGPSIALSLGRAIGCIEGLLHALNVGEKAVGITDQAWRKTELPTIRNEIAKLGLKHQPARAYWKQAAIKAVAVAHKVDVSDDAAEAILLNDHVVLHRPDLWGGVYEQGE